MGKPANDLQYMRPEEYLLAVDAPMVFNAMVAALLKERPSGFKGMVKCVVSTLGGVFDYRARFVEVIRRCFEAKVLSRYWERWVGGRKGKCLVAGIGLPGANNPQKFGEGVQNPMRLSMAVAATYRPPTLATSQATSRDIIKNLDTWRSPTALPLWPQNTIANLVADSDFLVANHSNSLGPDDVRSLYIYTHSQLCHDVLWAIWQPALSTWVPIPAKLTALLEAKRGDTLELPIVLHDCAPGDTELIKTAEYQYGLEVYSDESRRTVVCRYVNTHRGVVGVSPFRDTVLWIPNGQDLNVLESGKIPYPGVLEYVASLSASEEVSGEGWLCRRLSDPGIKSIRAQCRRMKNQKARDDKLWQEVESLLEDEKYGLVKKIVMHKISSEDMRTPEELARVLTIQELQWKDKEYYLVLTTTSADTTQPHILCDTATGEILEIYRVISLLPEQVYWRLNQAMRESHFNRHVATISLTHPNPPCHKCGHPSYLGPSPHPCSICHHVTHTAPIWVCTMCPANQICTECYPTESYLSSQPCDISTLDTPCVFTDEKKMVLAATPSTALHIFEVKFSTAGSYGYSVPSEGVWIDFHGWLHRQAEGLVGYIQLALQAVPHGVNEGTTIITYRGMNCRLPCDVYIPGNVVVWGQYSSSSDDQGVAAMFAGGEGAASVFVIEGTSCKMISAWSRFAREREWLYPPGSMFKVVTALAEETRQILGKDNLQLFEVQEISLPEAEELTVRRLLPEATNLAEANVILQAAEAVSSRGTGVLSLDLEESDQGAVTDHYARTVKISTDAFQTCPADLLPLGSSVVTMGSSEGKAASEIFARYKANEGPSIEAIDNLLGAPGVLREYTAKITNGSQDSLMVTITRKGGLTVGEEVVRNPTGWLGGDSDGGAGMRGTVMEITEHGVGVSWQDGVLKRGYGYGQGNAYSIRPADRREEAWVIKIMLRKINGRPGFALGPDGAAILEALLELKVHLTILSLSNHGLTDKGVDSLTRGIHANPHVRDVQLGITGPMSQAKKDYVAMVCMSRSDRIEMPFLLGLGESMPRFVSECMCREPVWSFPFSSFLWVHGGIGRELFTNLWSLRKANCVEAGGLPQGALLLLASSDWEGHQEAFEEHLSELLDSGCDAWENHLGRTGLYFLSARGSVVATETSLGLFRRIIKRSAAVINQQHGADAKYADGRSPLHMAAAKGHPQTAIELISQGADPALRELYSKRTALIAAVRRWSVSDDEPSRVAITLLTTPETINTMDSAGKTPLCHATSKGMKDNVVFLLSKGADPRCTTDYGETPLSIAVERMGCDPIFGEIKECLDKALVEWEVE